MRKILFLCSLGAACFFISCNDTATVQSASTGSAEVQKNLEASHAIDDAYKTGDVSKLENYVSADYMDHTDHGDIKGIDSMKASVKMVHDNFSNMNMEMIKEMAEGDYVFSWMRFTGNSNGKFMPAGPFDMHAMEMAKFKDGKCVEHWEYDDPGEMMKMMGQMQNMEKMNNKAAMDTTKMKSK